jgi:hypothetical protein
MEAQYRTLPKTPLHGGLQEVNKVRLIGLHRGITAVIFTYDIANIKNRNMSIYIYLMVNV